MTHEEIIEQMAAIKRVLDEERTEIWVEIIEMDGSISERIYQGSFVRTRDPKEKNHE